jgi:hypothetical protein
MILDVYWSFLIGLVDFDTIRALDFQSRHKTLAARVGDPKHIACSLAMDAANEAAFSGRDSPRIRNLIARARAVCAEIDAPEAIGFINTTEAICVWMTGDWDRASRLAEEAERFLSEHCSGVAWEHATAIGLRVDTAFHRGEWAKLADYNQHFRGRLENARARGDLHALVVSMLEGAMGFLIADQPELAEQFLLEMRGALPQHRFLLPNIWALGIQVFIALYVGDAERAWSLVESSWRNVEKSKFLRVQWATIAAVEPRARAAIAAAAAKGGSAGYLKVAAACAATLARKNPRWATPLSLLIQAGVANVRRERQETLDFLQRAETEFQTCGMAQYVAVCKYRRGMLIAGEEGRILIAAAEGWAKSQRVVNPARVFDMLTPGQWKLEV